MGEAKRRGTYEQRKAGAVQKREAAQAEADARACREYEERTRNPPPRKTLAGWAGGVMAAAFAVAGGPITEAERVRRAL